MHHGQYIIVPAAVSQKCIREQQQARIRRARYEIKRADPHHGKGKGVHHGPAPFVFWDGEGPQDAGYALFGNSMGDEICHPFLSTLECFRLLEEREIKEPRAIHIWFGSNYDVSMILADLSKRHLNALKVYGKTVWREYEIEHIPRKWLKIRHGGLSITLYDIYSFFTRSYVAALLDFGIGSNEEILAIQAGKGQRENFLWADIAEIRDYFRKEVAQGPALAESLRTVFKDAGYVPRSWHGPGALARMALQRHHVYDAMAVCPVDVRIAA